MKLKEQIDVIDARRRLPSAAFSRLALELGFKEFGLSLVLRCLLEDERRAEFDLIAQSMDPQVEVRRRIFAEYESADYREAAALELAIPEVWLDEVMVPDRCKQCGRAKARSQSFLTYSVRVSAPVALVNGKILIVSRAVSRAADQRGLTGADYPPFSTDGRSRYVRIARDLNTAPGSDSQPASECEGCGRPVIRPRIGPLQFLEAAAAGVDLFECSGFSTIVFRRGWIDLLQRVEPLVQPWRPVGLVGDSPNDTLQPSGSSE